MVDLQIRIGCVSFTPHGWDVCGAVIRLAYGPYALTNFDRLILDLCSVGY